MKTKNPAQRFEHYELAEDTDGRPVELGRGGMGVTYKAFDVDLQYPVALKVISERYLCNDTVRLRFLREARAAASVRHPNVASVFHLGRTGKNYFYAMEFVEGETLEDLLNRSGRLEVKLALEIATQVAAGLDAVHRQKLVHRDIKPSNIMVSFEERGTVTAKIIDLGLAKPTAETGSQTVISAHGHFAGTPKFASPEQFSGVAVDIRSDLYSLGATLWKTVTGDAVFSGSGAEIMFQHQHAPLPMEKLEGVPQPVVVLLEILLEKDPARRFQNPVELLKAIPRITSALEARRKIARQSLQKVSRADWHAVARRPPARLGPRKISVARLPITGGGVFGREEDIAFLDAAWANQRVNVVSIIAWAGVGKSALVNHWLARMAADYYRSAKFVFGWSFYRQGTSGQSSSADEFLEAALVWFGDSNPRMGTAWEKGRRLAKLIAHHRTLLVLDGLEPLQNPSRPQEGRIREPCLQALLRELAAFNRGLCVITTRLPVADIADHENSSALRRDLEQLSRDAGANLLRALGVRGDEENLRSASDEFGGHCLALTLLGSYLTDVYQGDVRRRHEVSKRLAHDVRQGAHARIVMESYQTWFGESPELSVLRMLGLFDRPADEKALAALLRPPAIPGLTESLVDLTATEWRAIVARLRRARLLTGKDPHHHGWLDTHPLVREYFGEQLRHQRAEAWQECNRRLYDYYRTVAPQLPDSFGEMEPLFLAVICGCYAGLCRDALLTVYIPRIQRGNAFFAANVLGARETLLTVIALFFADGRWDSPVQTGVEGQRLTAEDELFVLTQAALYLTATRGPATAETLICYQRAESLCHSLDRPLLLYVALMGQWRYSLNANKLTATRQIAERVYSLARKLNDPALMMGACHALAATFYFLGNFEDARKHATLGVQIWRSGAAQSSVEDVETAAVTCLCYQALCEWHAGENASSQATMAEAMSLAKELNDMHGLAVVLCYAAGLGYVEGNRAEVERQASELIQLSTCQNFPYWIPIATIFRGWARSASGDTAQGISWIEDGIRDHLAGSILTMPVFLAIKAEALYLADRAADALAAIKEAEALVEISAERRWCAELNRLRGLLLATLDADETEIEASFRAAISIAREQKSPPLVMRAEASYAEYRRRRVP